MKNKFHSKIKKLKESDVTDLKLYMNRKSFIESSGRKAQTIGLAMSPAMDFLGKTLGILAIFSLNAYTLPELKKLNTNISSNYAKNEDLTKLEYITGYNKFYEFSTRKENVSEEAKNFISSP